MKDVIDINYLKSLAKDIMLEANDQELDYILSVEESILEKLKKVTSIDTTNVEPTFYPLKDIHNFLREDNNPEVIDQECILKNAPTSKDECVTIAKVVN
ncbi:Asp-tRNA(Asn)/Glu-tRNA(Gln) amidotransferase subunit GatC [Mycoplasma yeatsii]|uniref:Asp-tRNA(Asn)/Glu-tRNA(Gln) amidotransferase subunit GatC n=1 Tax=Mycoplasma yeatsii TaxID=51365 RepID=UPI0005B241D9|nr:Asp-tRNA(Asn)/Glu-tRNA(Gln) amidotransferase subunit GatC [Mycoplasma yeatsii]AJM71677.1 glutamyl-tRNA(Gln)amidotransferase subunit C [Mycoplasma yeatsii GM274B]